MPCRMPPSGFYLTAEQEQQLAADLKEIVLALLSLRNGKLNNRQYFNFQLDGGLFQESGILPETIVSLVCIRKG